VFVELYLFRRLIWFFYSLENFRYRTRRTPKKRRTPKREIPREKDPIFHMMPMPAAITPPPKRKPTDMVREGECPSQWAEISCRILIPSCFPPLLVITTLNQGCSFRNFNQHSSCTIPEET
jgi:hypothetical protein